MAAAAAAVVCGPDAATRRALVAGDGAGVVAAARLGRLAARAAGAVADAAAAGVADPGPAVLDGASSWVAACAAVALGPGGADGLGAVSYTHLTLPTKA